MLTIVIISVGKKHDATMKDVIDKYQLRLSRYCKLEWRIIPSSDKSTESDRILSSIQKSDEVVLLDETGEHLNNKLLTGFIEDASVRASVSRLVFIIGGSYGVDQILKNQIKHIYSLSGLILPHQIVRLILVEQIYRSYTIIKGLQYHHE